MENIIVKVRCNGDIRRMAVEDNLNLKSLRELLSKLYNVRNFKIYRDDLDLIPISDEVELYHILKMVRNSSTKVLRLALVEEPEEIAATSIERVLMRGDMRVKLEEAIIESVKTRPVMDAIIEKMLPQIVAAMDTKDEDLSGIVIRSVDPSVIEESMSSSTASSSCSEVSSSSSLDQSISPEDEESAVAKEKEVSQKEEESSDDEEEFESRDEDEPMLDESKREEEVVVVEEEPKKEEIFEREVENREEEAEAEESEENREPVVSVEPELTESQAASPFKAFMTLVRSIVSKKDSDNKVDIANLEDMLKQLNEMGFTDRESNLKLVKFHNQFKEGLDEVVEALLTQSQLDANSNTEVRVSSH